MSAILRLEVHGPLEANGSTKRVAEEAVAALLWAVLQSCEGPLIVSNCHQFYPFYLCLPVPTHTSTLREPSRPHLHLPATPKPCPHFKSLKGKGHCLSNSVSLEPGMAIGISRHLRNWKKRRRGGRVRRAVEVWAKLQVKTTPLHGTNQMPST